ncbi:MAG: transporter substrate-binding domain-containing protein [Ruminococcus sp.]|uniref:transporter substrate-binding domain-containing protein n=1 Tax=Ruminococcus sp. TaxID=41978 RepID=UPI0025E78016|nr:transporter substrate-binding domain-containing protein [Ruminococcus sp.]MCR5541200.1 transporter substrate-binding domain-containing protein [Ruminococcus sp.]
MRSRFLRTVCTALTAGVMALTFAGCGSSSGDAKQSSGGDGKVLRVGMECAYAPFNWTQIGEEVPDGSKAVPIYGTSEYAYGYDVMVAQKLADDLGMSLEIHKVEWDSIGLSLDAKEYDCIIAGMGRTKEREASYSFTEPYYYRDNCLVVKKGSDYESVKGLSDFKGKNVTVTTQLGTGWVPLLDQIPDATLGANYETTAEVFMAVSNGVADVALIDLPTAESALLTNTDLTIVVPDESDAFEGDKEMTNVCIATRKDDTELRDKLQKAMDDIGWSDKAKMDELMSKAVELQPAAN